MWILYWCWMLLSFRWLYYWLCSWWGRCFSVVMWRPKPPLTYWKMLHVSHTNLFHISELIYPILKFVFFNSLPPYLPLPSSPSLHTISDRWSGTLTCDPWDCNCTFNQQSGCCCGAKDLYQLEDDTIQRLKYLWQDISSLDTKVQAFTGKHAYTDRRETKQYVWH